MIRPASLGPRLRRRAAETGRFALFALKRFWADRCTQSAAALTYTSLLALVPLTTIMVMLLSAFPAFEAVEESARQMIFDNLVPQVGESVSQYLQGFADNAGRLTSVGIIGLMVTSVLLLATIEGAFNAIWRVREARSLLVRLLAFWAILTLTPLLFAASLSVTNQLFRGAGFTGGLPVANWVGILPFLFEAIAFTLLYWIIPNRSVDIRDALTGGAVAALLFELSKSLFGLYLTAFPVYETIYGALSTIPIFLVWLYVGWSTVLLGAEVSAALPDFRADRLIGGYHRLTTGQRLVLALAVLEALADGSRRGVGVRRRHLLRQLPVGTPVIDGMLAELRNARYVVRAANEQWVLSRDLASVTIDDLARDLDVGLTVGAHDVPGASGAWFDRASAMLRGLDKAAEQSLAVPLATLLAPSAATAPVPDAQVPDNTVSLPRPGRREPSGG